MPWNEARFSAFYSEKYAIRRLFGKVEALRRVQLLVYACSAKLL